MPDTTAIDPVPLDAPLPRELTGSDRRWLTRYRLYPVFSPAWVRGRWRFGLLLVGIVIVALFLSIQSSAQSRLALVSLPTFAFSLLAPLVLGPLAGLWVRRQQWSPDRERLALWGVMLALVASMAVFHHWGAEPVKLGLAEALGLVDADGKRPRMTIGLGLSIDVPDEPPTAPANGSGKAMSADQDGVASRTLSAGFQALMTLCIAGGLAVPRVRREREVIAALARDRALAQAQAERREAELRLSVLAAQVEPHFLFNTLAGVRSAIATDPARASDMVDRLTAYLRAAIPRLRSDGAAAATLASQAEIVRAYLALMQARMPRLTFQVDVPADLAQLPFPPLMLISLAENAVKHGVEPKMGPAAITLSAARDAQGRLAVTVADDGVGFGGATAGSGLGLGNLRERLHQLYQGRAELTLKARPDGGVAATLTIPLEETAA